MNETAKKVEQLDFFEINNADYLEKCRKKARYYCYCNHGLMKYGIPYTVTSDDVRELMGIDTTTDKSNNVNGAIFRKGFEWTGEMYCSKARNGHGNLIKIWSFVQIVGTKMKD